MKNKHKKTPKFANSRATTVLGESETVFLLKTAESERSSEGKEIFKTDRQTDRHNRLL